MLCISVLLHLKPSTESAIFSNVILHLHCQTGLKCASSYFGGFILWGFITRLFFFYNVLHCGLVSKLMCGDHIALPYWCTFAYSERGSKSQAISPVCVLMVPIREAQSGQMVLGFKGATLCYAKTGPENAYI